ncbi:MAG: histidinol-phosphate transaminase [Clostridia bacterium]|nr:histidinol-phosphate transaminase [Clostridia bacterium]
MSRFLHERYRSMEAYTPGEQPQDMEYIKLNTNESPYQPSPEVIAAVSHEEVEKLRLYPDPECKELRDALANRFGAKRENIFVSNGSDDILNFAFMAFAGLGGSVTFPEISYGFYQVFAELHGINFRAVPLKQDFSIDIAEYTKNDSMVVIANPNAPTGLMLSKDEVETILKSNPDHVVLIDEAYIDFGGTSCASLVERYDNLLVVQTFSKSRSLAGGRLGFAIANSEMIKDLEKIKYSTNPYSINRLTLLAGTAAIASDGYFMDKCKEIVETREYTKEELKKSGFTVTDSFANFLFVKKDGISGEEVYRKLRENGILVRHFTKESICDYNRVTVGTREQMETFLQVIRKICEV